MCEALITSSAIGQPYGQAACNPSKPADSQSLGAITSNSCLSLHLTFVLKPEKCTGAESFSGFIENAANLRNEWEVLLAALGKELQQRSHESSSNHLRENICKHI